MFPMPVIALFCIYFYLLMTGDMITIYSGANGLWWHRRYVSMLEITVNLVLNFVLGKFLGIYGIIIATIITIFMCNFIWGIRITFKHYFQLTRLKEYYYYHLKYFLVTLFLWAVTYSLCLMLPDCHILGSFLLRMVLCIFLPNTGYVLIYRKSKIYNQSIGNVRKILER